METRLMVEDFSAWYGHSQAVKDINLPIYASQVTAIIGPLGCGKSTFIRYLNRLHEVIPGTRTRGRIRLDSHSRIGGRGSPGYLRPDPAGRKKTFERSQKPPSRTKAKLGLPEQRQTKDRLGRSRRKGKTAQSASLGCLVVIAAVDRLELQASSKYSSLAGTVQALSPKNRCTKNKKGGRTVTVSKYERYLQEGRAYQKTEEFAREYPERCKIERSRQKIRHGIRKARYIGLAEVTLQALFVGAVVNFKRYWKLLIQKAREEAALAAATPPPLAA